jgi:CheY-like chemotaxis protein
MRELIVLVNADPATLRKTERRLSEEGYLVAAVGGFERAKALLTSITPDLLVVDVRLHAFNGLHLAARSKLDRPALQVIVTHATEDPVLDREAARQGARFVVNPLENPQFLDLVKSALQIHHTGESMVRRWRRKRAVSDVPVRAGVTDARLVDFSYGGAKLEWIDDDLAMPPAFQVTLAGLDISLPAQRVWTGRSGEQRSCGVALVETSSPDAVRWRGFVDDAD